MHNRSVTLSPDTLTRRLRIAAMLGCHGDPRSWPHALIGRLDDLLRDKGEEALRLELYRLMTPPARALINGR